MDALGLQFYLGRSRSFRQITHDAWSMRAMQRLVPVQKKEPVEPISCEIPTSETASIGLQATRCSYVSRSQLQRRLRLAARFEPADWMRSIHNEQSREQPKQRRQSTSD